MRLFSGNYRLLGWITLILVGGFVTTSAAAYLASRDAIEHSISEQALPLTGDLIYSGLQKDILYPVFVASMMAQDPAVQRLAGRAAKRTRPTLPAILKKPGTGTAWWPASWPRTPPASCTTPMARRSPWSRAAISTNGTSASSRCRAL
ncbi:hypothetical protein LP420_19690 [Massilia sp. B-10]|nr:hypothetical protein LP420_19690 [Massilia sp. B-10]